MSLSLALCWEPVDPQALLDFLTLPIDTPLIEAGQQLLCHRQGALPVVDDGRLVGILSSVDFVRLAVNLLEA